VRHVGESPPPVASGRQRGARARGVRGRSSGGQGGRTPAWPPSAQPIAKSMNEAESSRTWLQP
jgi:hypothetical protein